MRVNYVKIAEYSSLVNTQNLKTDFFEAATKGATIFNPHRITVCRNGSFLLDIAQCCIQITNAIQFQCMVISGCSRRMFTFLEELALVTIPPC